VKALLGGAGPNIIDVRTEPGWRLFEPSAAFVAGHIPGSLSFRPESLLRDESGLPNAAALREQISLLGPRDGDPVALGKGFILYGDGQDDQRVEIGYLLFRAAGLDVQVYLGGWTDWMAEPTSPRVRIISTAELKALIHGEKIDPDAPTRAMALIDSREARDYSIGHVPGAINLPQGCLETAFLPVMRFYWPGSEPVDFPLVFYCYDRECVRSRNAATLAARNGYTDLRWYREGALGWRQARLPMATRPSDKE
jgi:rhodanese-related sulfurtransferase